jgi:hypothetical protein
MAEVLRIQLQGDCSVIFFTTQKQQTCTMLYNSVRVLLLTPFLDSACLVGVHYWQAVGVEYYVM